MWGAGWLVGLVGLAALGCHASATHPQPRPPAHDAMARHLTLDAITAPGVEVNSGAELLRALDEQQRPIARLAEVVSVTWRDRTFDRETLGDMLAGNYQAETRTRFKARFGIDYDVVFRVFLHGYAAQLSDRFGITPRDMGISDENGRWILTVRGTLGDRSVQWRSGVFTAGPPEAAVGKPLPARFETVLVANNSDYYTLAELGANALFEGKGPASERVHRGEARRTYLERAEYTDASGHRFSYRVPIDSPTPYFMVRPGGLDQLTEELHVVRVEMDQTAQPGSAALIESFVVLDGTRDLAALAPAHKAVWTRFPTDRAAALAKAAPQLADADAALARHADEWAREQSPPGTRHTDRREYNTTRPSYRWDPATRTLTLGFRHTYSVIIRTNIAYPNPELEHVHCPPGVPCAVPPDEAYHVLEQRYDVELEATYDIDRAAQVTTRALTGPALHLR